MSELQIGLLVSAIIIVALVFALGELYVWRERKKINKNFSYNQLDVLLDIPKNHVRDTQKDEHLKPFFAGTANPIEQEHVDVDVDVDADANQIATEQNISQAQQEKPEVKKTIAEEPIFLISLAELTLIDLAWFDPKLDFIADIALKSATKIKNWPLFGSTRRINIAGCTNQGLWHIVSPLSDINYIAFRIGLQCVDRNGAIKENELTSFYREVVKFAQDIDAEISLPPRQKQLDSAKKLDVFCAEVDVLVGIHMLFNRAVDGKILSEILDSSGFVLEPDGAFHYFNDKGCSLYSISSREQQLFEAHLLAEQQIKALTLLFDIPRVAGGLDAFDDALAFAIDLVEQLDGKLVDDNQRELSEVGLHHIRQQIQQIYERMQEQGIEPGEDLAMRLFS